MKESVSYFNARDLFSEIFESAIAVELYCLSNDKTGASSTSGADPGIFVRGGVQLSENFDKQKKK